MVQVLKERWLVIVLVIVAVVFIAQNRRDVRIDFLWANLTMPLWLTLTLVTAVGVAIGWFLRRRQQR